MKRYAVILAMVAVALALGAPSSNAKPKGAYLVVDITGFFGPSCSVAAFTVANQGAAEQPFGWTLTLEVKKLGISQTYVGQQALAPGETRETALGTGITEPGTYPVRISPGDVSRHFKAGHAVLRLPRTCG